MSTIYKIFLIVVLSVFSDTNLSPTDAPSGLPSKFASTFSKLGGYVNAESGFLLSQGDVFSKVFKYEARAGVAYASELRYLRHFLMK